MNSLNVHVLKIIKQLNEGICGLAKRFQILVLVGIDRILPKRCSCLAAKHLPILRALFMPLLDAWQGSACIAKAALLQAEASWKLQHQESLC